MNRVNHARLFSLAVLSALVGCSGGGSTTGSLQSGGGFVVLQTEPLNNARLYLNDPISIDFTRKVDLSSVNLNTFSFQVLDQTGTAVFEPVAGDFALATSPGDTDVGRRLQFVPRFPTNNTFDNGGFRPGRTYIVQLVGGNQLNGTVIRDQGGKGLSQAFSFRCQTAEGSTPNQLFRNTVPGGPRRAALEISPTPDASGVSLNKLGSPPVEVRLVFDQALNPNSDNVPTAVQTNPLLRSANARGRVFLEYDDPERGVNTWIPSDVELESNGLDGSTLVLRPVGVLPNNATVRVIVESTLEDISGESNVSNAAYERIFGTFQTKRSYEQQFDALVNDFQTAASVDFEAPFSEPVAEVGPGYIKAGFAFEGTQTTIEYEPTLRDTILNTDFTQVVPKVGTPYNVSGGVFNFKNVKIPAGVKVQGQGTNPMVFLVSGSFEIEGELSVRGGDGTRVNSSGTAYLPKAGGVGVCAGGDGGDGSPSATQRDLQGGTGKGPRQVTAGGGVGGRLACTAGCIRGSGGGGGSLATQGDPNYKQKTIAAGAGPGNPPNPLPIFQQQVGIGGNGCDGSAGTVTRTLTGGIAGPIVFGDSRNDNNFWGSAINVNRNLRITGELSLPIGGGGGGGGGDLSYNGTCTVEDVNFQNDSSGGGGGGGGGVLIVKALGPIIITESGRVTADGGHGGGGEQGGSSTRGGGGGGGAGGMVVLMSATRIEINAHGSNGLYTYAQNNYDFSVSADGGVCRTEENSSPRVVSKYPASGLAVLAGSSYDAKPLGGFGGMGIVQLMAPPGDNSDNSNTVLDDNIRVYRNGLELTGTSTPTKQSILAWRGFPNAQGQFVDDFGTPTNIGDDEGDIRPAPLLMPVPFSSQTRLRSKWLDTGASLRRALLADDGLPRGIVEAGGALAGPTYLFDGTDPATGYAVFNTAGDRGENAQAVYPAVGPQTGILSVDSNATFQGRPAYRVELDAATLGDVVDLYTQYEAEMLDAAGDVLYRKADGSVTTSFVEGLEKVSFRIYSHTNRVLTLATEAGTIPVEAAKVQLRAKFFKFVTNGREGLGGTYPASVGQSRVPLSNVRIGFAFHQDPANPSAQRYPAQAGSYVYDLNDPVVKEDIRQLGASFVQWDIFFDCAFKSLPSDTPPAFGPGSPLPELHFLRLPFRF
ncbi:MAG: hypothetical protein H6838_20515 [Planctomycetes bacterium]|nr:hypothetical protein [Planctomycetota bacterium]